jgi:hypothetical protein
MEAFRQAAASLLGCSHKLTLQGLLDEQQALTERLEKTSHCNDAGEIWQRLGVEHPERVADMDVEQLQALKASQILGAS